MYISPDFSQSICFLMLGGGALQQAVPIQDMRSALAGRAVRKAEEDGAIEEDGGVQRGVNGHMLERTATVPNEKEGRKNE